MLQVLHIIIKGRVPIFPQYGKLKKFTEFGRRQNSQNYTENSIFYAENFEIWKIQYFLLKKHKNKQIQ